MIFRWLAPCGFSTNASFAPAINLLYVTSNSFPLKSDFQSKELFTNSEKRTSFWYALRKAFPW